MSKNQQVGALIGFVLAAACHRPEAPCEGETCGAALNMERPAGGGTPTGLTASSRTSERDG